MAVKNAVYQVDNGNEFDEIHFKTNASQVYCDNGETVEVNFEKKVNKSIIKYTATLLNGWTNREYYQSAKYYKDDMDIVHLEGVVNGGSSGIIFNLPEGFRPKDQILFPTVCFVGSAVTPLFLIVKSDGNVEINDYRSGMNSFPINLTFKI